MIIKIFFSKVLTKDSFGAGETKVILRMTPVAGKVTPSPGPPPAVLLFLSLAWNFSVSLEIPLFGHSVYKPQVGNCCWLSSLSGRLPPVQQNPQAPPSGTWRALPAQL